jgi:hypothetical protein
LTKQYPDKKVYLKKTTMDTQIITWEMNMEQEQSSVPREEIATWPTEPYTLDWDTINWN